MDAHRQWLALMLARAEARLQQYEAERDHEMTAWWRALLKALQRRARQLSRRA